MRRYSQHVGAGCHSAWGHGADVSVLSYSDQSHRFIDLDRSAHHHHDSPNFKGAAEAAARLAGTPEFQNAEVIKTNPDTPQHTVGGGGPAGMDGCM